MRVPHSSVGGVDAELEMRPAAELLNGVVAAFGRAAQLTAGSTNLLSGVNRLAHRHVDAIQVLVILGVVVPGRLDTHHAAAAVISSTEHGTTLDGKHRGVDVHGEVGSLLTVLAKALCDVGEPG